MQMTVAGKPVDVDSAEREFHAAMAAPAADEPLAAAPPKRDADAPYGRKADGSARKRPAGPGRSRARTQSSPAVAAAGKSETAAESRQRRAEGVAGLFQIGSAATFLIYQRTDVKAWYADTLTLAAHARPAGLAIADVCEANPKFAATIDKITAAGPYAALLTVGFNLSAQLASNHGITAARAVGAKSPEDVIAEHESTGNTES